MTFLLSSLVHFFLCCLKRHFCLGLCVPEIRMANILWMPVGSPMLAMKGAPHGQYIVAQEVIIIYFSVTDMT